MNADIIVIGGGTVGAAICYGIASRGGRAILLDGNDRDFRAATANFGLVWLQGKGLSMPEYQNFSRRSIDLWPEFAEELTEATGKDLQLEQRGGLTICLSDAEFEDRSAKLHHLHNQLAQNKADWEMLDRASLDRLMPGVKFGLEVVGAGYGYRDGHCDPLTLLSALHKGIARKGGQVIGGSPVRKIETDKSGNFIVSSNSRSFSAARIVLAAGLGTKELAAQVGLDLPIRPQRGQILVTERLEKFLPLPMSGLRQTRQGTVMIGATHDEVGFDKSATVEGAAALGARAIRRIPALKGVKLVRQWAGLRIMTPDGYPIYTESASHPGAFVALCHSGITLAALHSRELSDGILAGSLPSSVNMFSPRRFDVQEVA